MYSIYFDFLLNMRSTRTSPTWITAPIPSTFGGLAVSCEQVCRGHGLEPVKCVAFEGANTGRRFYKYSMLNVSLNHSSLIDASSR
jgi:hypothetical protein